MNAAINPVEAVAAIPATPEAFIATLPVEQIEKLRDLIAKNARFDLLQACDARTSKCQESAPVGGADPQVDATGSVDTKSAELPAGGVAVAGAPLVGGDPKADEVLPSGWTRICGGIRCDFASGAFVERAAAGYWHWPWRAGPGVSPSMLLAMCRALGINIVPSDHGWHAVVGSGHASRIRKDAADECARAALEAFHAAQTKLPAPIVEPAASAPPRSSAEQSTIGAGAVSKDELRMARTQRLATRALEHFGVDSRIDKLLEEMAELQVALCHYRDGKASTQEVIGELADVAFVLAQLQETFGYRDVLEVMHAKADVLEVKMNAEAPVPGADGEARWVAIIRKLEAQLAQARAVIR